MGLWCSEVVVKIMAIVLNSLMNKGTLCAAREGTRSLKALLLG